MGTPGSLLGTASLASLLAPHSTFSSQGLTGPIGPPGPAGANGEKVSHGTLSSLCPHQISFSPPAKDCSPSSPRSTAVTLLLSNCCKECGWGPS